MLDSTLPDLGQDTPAVDRVMAFRALPLPAVPDAFLPLSTAEQVELLRALDPAERRVLMRLLAPDDAADLVQAVDDEERADLLAALDDATRTHVQALLAYAEDDAGGLMNTQYARVRPEQTAEEALAYLRRQARERTETLYYTYVLGAEQELLGVLSIRALFAAGPHTRVRDIMKPRPLCVRENTDQEEVARLIARYDLLAIPVVDELGRMKGIIAIDDVVDVLAEEATEDIQKLGGSEALDAPYMATPFRELLKKRAGWLTVLFVGEMLTATAMGAFEDAIARTVALSLFIPLIISSGGNAGSQASTLIVRALATGDVHLRDWGKVLSREIASGLALGLILGSVGLFRIVVWPWRDQLYGPQWLPLGISVAMSLVGVVLWGGLAGAMLPFALRRLGFDPASASAPLVATVVDVTGLLIYFSVATAVLGMFG